ncbi:hypothetical protein SAMN05216480_11820 [Pustulibacterium marinum]|uniref:Uncharacterized protein n=1 Tax=Pustulibacterium marinum TaxID=1224947 RepID=A0A1I7IMS3_9FLAO|nr:hypothetical protein SAMN05216480_11820 [Pustulibacterium marinum]
MVEWFGEGCAKSLLRIRDVETKNTFIILQRYFLFYDSHIYGKGIL